MCQGIRSVTRMAMASGLLVAGFWLEPRAVSAQDVSVDWDKKADFGACATYAWAKGQPAQNPLVDKRIVEAIEGALAAEGWKKVQDDPGCYVTYHASVKEQRGLDIWASGGRWMGGMGSVDVRTVVNGMLVVDITEAAGRRLIWRGVARDSLSDKPEKNQKKLAKTMEKMFKDFPPASATKKAASR